MEGYLEAPPITEVDPKHEELQEKSIEALKKMEILSEIENGELSVDLDKLKSFSTRVFKDSVPREKDGGISPVFVRDNAGSTEKLFTGVLAGLEVYKKGEEELGKKKLVFIPETAEDLSDITKMENSWTSLGDIGITTSWESRHPTDNPDLNLSKMEVHVPYLIYKHGRGARDEKGVLWVDKVVGEPESGRQKISGNWLKRNGFKGTTEFPVDQNISSLVEEYGAEWVRQGLLKSSDFPQSVLRHREWSVQEQGRLEIKNIAYWVGAEYSSGKAVPIAPNEFLIYDKDGVPAAVLNSNIPRTKYSETTVVNRGNGRKALLVNKSAVQVTPIDDLGTFTNLAAGNEKVREKVSVAREIQGLLDLQKGLQEEHRTALLSFELKDQINISRSLRRIGEYGPRPDGNTGMSFLEKTGKAGMQILADAEASGGLDIRLLELTNLEPEKLEDLLKDYTSFRSSIERTVTVLYEKCEKSKLDQNTLTLISRIREAIVSRSNDFLLADMNAPEKTSEMKKLSEALESISQVVEGNCDYRFMPGEDKQTGAKQGRYEMEDGSQLNVIIRAEESEKAQARISFVYRDKTGSRTDLRLDSDPHGLSLDIACRGTAFHETLSELGKSHHTSAQFEPGLSNSRSEFKNLTEKLPVILGWN